MLIRGKCAHHTRVGANDFRGQDHSTRGQADFDSPCCVPSHLKPVVDISSGVDVPALDGRPHTFLHLCPLGLTDTPGLGPIEHDVGQDTTGIIRNLDAIGLAFQQVATKRKKEKSIMYSWIITQTVHARGTIPMTLMF